MRRPPKKNHEPKIINTNTLLVDGNSLFKVAFNANKTDYNEKGEYVGGLISFFVILRKILTENLYHKVYIFWDGEFSGKLRYNIYKPYKSGRGKDYENGTKPVDIIEITQKKLIWEYLNDLYIRQLKHDFVESDDMIAFYCKNKKNNEYITIVSGDSDFLQLISDKVRIYFLRKKKYINIDNYKSHFNYHKDNAVLIKTMVGDTSDSIKGIKGLGEANLIKLFPEIMESKITISEIINKAKELQEQRLNEKKKPLKILDNIINKVTDGVQGDLIYEINDILVNLTNPLVTEDVIININSLINGTLHESGRELKNIILMMKRDGLDKILGENRYSEFLIPFKQLINRE